MGEIIDFKLTNKNEPTLEENYSIHISSIQGKLDRFWTDGIPGSNPDQLRKVRQDLYAICKLLDNYARIKETSETEPDDATAAYVRLRRDGEIEFDCVPVKSEEEADWVRACLSTVFDHIPLTKGKT